MFFAQALHSMLIRTPSEREWKEQVSFVSFYNVAGEKITVALPSDCLSAGKVWRITAISITFPMIIFTAQARKKELVHSCQAAAWVLSSVSLGSTSCAFPDRRFEMTIVGDDECWLHALSNLEFFFKRSYKHSEFHSIKDQSNLSHQQKRWIFEPFPDITICVIQTVFPIRNTK